MKSLIEKKYPRLNFRISPKEKKHVEEIARKKGMNISELIKYSLRLMWGEKADK